MKKKAPARKPAKPAARKPARRPARQGGTQLVASAPAPKPSLLPRSAFPDAPSYYDYLDWRLAFP